MKNYRLYTAANIYLSPIQVGIQTAHVTSELSVKYNTASHAADVYWGWATNNKTIICLNGGYTSNLLKILEAFKDQEDYPFAHFNESHEAMEGMLTSVGIILPECVYSKMPDLNTPPSYFTELRNDIDTFLFEMCGLSLPKRFYGDSITTGLSQQEIDILNVLRKLRLA